jgi:hypothetical protein
MACTIKFMATSRYRAFQHLLGAHSICDIGVFVHSVGALMSEVMSHRSS